MAVDRYIYTNMSKASRNRRKKKMEERGRGRQSIDRLVAVQWGVPLLKTRVHLGIYILLSPTLELVRGKTLGTSGPQAPTAGMERRDWKKKKGPSPYYESNARSSYTERYTATRVTLPCCSVRTHCMQCRLFSRIYLENSRTRVKLYNHVPSRGP